MASSWIPVLMALIFCAVCTWTPCLSAAPPPPPALISVCPAFDSSVCPYSKPGRPECQNDSQCPTSKKCCCFGNCGVLCVPPEKVRAGRCPDIKAKCRPEPTDNCTTDSDCPGSQKCCKICGRTCWNPEPELKGTCPKNDGAQSKFLECSSVKCSRNSDCKAWEKCCPSGDGQSCVNALTAKSGRCPSSLTIKCIRASYTCKSDDDCSGKQKCCDICGRNCWSPEPAPPPPPALISVCPAFNSSVCLHSKPGRPECQNDSQCPKSKKCCCSGNCGVMCVTPEKVRAGRCPDIKAKCRPEPTYNCTTDSDCPGSQKCCNICGRTCWNPEPELKGTCPKNDGAQSDSLQCSSVKCSRNSDCKTREKCCPSGDGQSCVNAQTAKSGRCPSLTINCFRASYTCESDDECSGNQKCCDICGRNCWNPEPDLISVCPAFNSSICIYARPGPAECHNDSQCSVNMKCCCSNCGLKCVPPEKVRAGRCPDIKAKCRPEPTYNCTTDSDCLGSQKCCSICGRTCWDPAPEPLGICPRNDAGQSGSLQCHSAQCSRDSDCKMNEKCCASGDGQTCVNST